MVEKIRTHLVDNVGSWYRHFTMWLAGLAAIIASFLSYSPDILLQIVNQLPPDMRKFLPGFVGPLLFVLLFLARYWKQRSKDC